MCAPKGKWVVFCSDKANPRYIHANNGGGFILGGRVDAKLWRHPRGAVGRRGPQRVGKSAAAVSAALANYPLKTYPCALGSASWVGAEPHAKPGAEPS